MSKLDWDMSAVIALDFVEHIVQRIRRFWPELGHNAEVMRRHAESLAAMCAGHHIFCAQAPSLVAAGCVLTTLRPLLESTPAPSISEMEQNQAFCSNESSGSGSSQRRVDLDFALDWVGKITNYTKVYRSFLLEITRPCLHFCLRLLQENVLQCMQEIESMVQAPPSIQGSATPQKAEEGQQNEDEVTPTKILDVAKNH